MKDLLGSLGLSAEAIRRRRDFASGHARAYEKQVDDGKVRGHRNWMFLAAATNYRRAAADSLLLDEYELARRHFQGAARAYEGAGSPMAVAMSQLGIELVTTKVSDELQPTLEAARVFELFDASLFTTVRSEAGMLLRSRLESVRSERIGIFGFQVSRYLFLFDAVQNEEWAPIREALFPLMFAYGEALLRAMSDTFHWERQAIPFHPVEPELLAVLVAISRRRQRVVVELFEGSGINQLALMCMREAVEIYRPARN